MHCCIEHDFAIDIINLVHYFITPFTDSLVMLQSSVLLDQESLSKLKSFSILACTWYAHC